MSHEVDDSIIHQLTDAYEVVIAGGKDRERLLNKIVAHQEDVIKLLREKCELLQKWFDAREKPECRHSWSKVGCIYCGAKQCDFFVPPEALCTLPKGHTGVHLTTKEPS